MALCKYKNLIKYSDHRAFDIEHAPGAITVNAGIYKCTVCGDEIGIAKGHELPPENHHQHDPGLGKIKWKLLVCTESIK